MHFERLRTDEDSRYLAALTLYKSSFPFHEQRNAKSQSEIMSHEEYHFNLLYDGTDFIGLLLCWETEHFIYVEHFCVNPEQRNKKYGARALELLNQPEKKVILEIDPPMDENSVRRKGFYERAGYQANNYEHIHPPYHRGYDGHRLVVMSWPSRLTDDEIQAFGRYLQKRVMAAQMN